MLKWHHCALEASNKMGIEGNPGPKLENWFKQAGFVKVQQKIVKIPLGTWPKDRTLKEIGHTNLEQALMGLEGLVVRLFTQALDWTPDEVQVFLIGLRKELKDPSIHAYYNM